MLQHISVPQNYLSKMFISQLKLRDSDTLISWIAGNFQ